MDQHIDQIRRASSILGITFMASVLAGCVAMSKDATTERVGKQLGFSEEEISKSKKMATREGYLELLAEDKKNSGKVVENPNPRVVASYLEADDNFTKGCSLAVGNGEAIRQKLMAQRGLLLPVYYRKNDVMAEVDWVATEKLHSSLSGKVKVSLLPISETRKFAQLVDVYMKEWAKRRVDEKGSGAADVGRVIGSLSTGNYDHFMENPFNTNQYSKWLIKNYSNVGYFVGYMNTYSQLSSNASDYELEFKSPGLTPQKLQERRAASRTTLDQKYKNARTDTWNKVALAEAYEATATSMSSGDMLNFETFEELTNLTEKPGFKFNHAMSCHVTNHQASLAGIESMKKMDQNSSDILKGMAGTFLTFGYKDLAEGVATNMNQEKLNALDAEANLRLKVASEKLEAAKLIRIKMMEKDFPNFLTRAFEKLKVAGFVKSTKIN